MLGGHCPNYRGRRGCENNGLTRSLIWEIDTYYALRMRSVGIVVWAWRGPGGNLQMPPVSLAHAWIYYAAHGRSHDLHPRTDRRGRQKRVSASIFSIFYCPFFYLPIHENGW